MNYGSYELTTQYEEGVGTYNTPFGTMFHVESKKNETITITSFDIHTSTTKYMNCLVWTRLGKIRIKDLDSTSTGWTLVANTTIKGNGIGLETPIPPEEFRPVEINPKENEVHSFIISLDEPNLVVIDFGSSSSSLTTNEIFSENSDMELYVGIGILEPFFTSNIKRNQVWSGTIWYSVTYDEQNDVTTTTTSGKHNKSSSSSALNNNINNKELFTSFQGKNRTYGNVFDIYAQKDIIIESLDFHTSIRDELVTVEIWTKVEEELKNLLSTSKDDDIDFSLTTDWTRVAYVNVTGMGSYIATSIPTHNFTSIRIKHRSVQAFYITLNVPGLICNDEYKLVTGDVFVTNDDLLIYLGAGVTKYPYDISMVNNNDNDALVPKIGFNGIIRYKVLTSTHEENEVLKCPTNLNGLYSELISSGYDGTIQSYGNMFDIHVLKTLVVRTLSLHINSLHNVYYSVWTKSGSFVGFEDKQFHHAWKFVTSGLVRARGTGKRTVLPPDEFPPILLTANMTQSFYITLDTPTILYSNDDDCTTTDYQNNETIICTSNQDIEILQGNGVNEPTFSSYTSFPRRWNGDLYYSLIDPNCNYDLFNFTTDYVSSPSSSATTSSTKEGSPLTLLSPNKYVPNNNALLTPNHESLNIEFFYFFVLQFAPTSAASKPVKQIMLETEKLWQRIFSKEKRYVTIAKESIQVLTYPIENTVLSYWCSDHYYVKHDRLCTVVNNSVTMSYDPTILSTGLEQFITQNVQRVLQTTVSSHFQKYQVVLIGPKLFSSEFIIVMSGTTALFDEQKDSLKSNFTTNDVDHVESNFMDYLTQYLHSNRIQIYNVSLLEYGLQAEEEELNNNFAARYGFSTLLLHIQVTGKVSDIDFDHNDLISQSFLIPHSSLVTKMASKEKFKGLTYITSSLLLPNDNSHASSGYISDEKLVNVISYIVLFIIGVVAAVIIAVLCVVRDRRNKSVKGRNAVVMDSSKSNNDRVKKRNSGDHARKRNLVIKDAVVVKSSKSNNDRVKKRNSGDHAQKRNFVSKDAVIIKSSTSNDDRVKKRNSGDHAIKRHAVIDHEKMIQGKNNKKERSSQKHNEDDSKEINMKSTEQEKKKNSTDHDKRSNEKELRKTNESHVGSRKSLEHEKRKKPTDHDKNSNKKELRKSNESHDSSRKSTEYERRKESTDHDKNSNKKELRKSNESHDSSRKSVDEDKRKKFGDHTNAKRSHEKGIDNKKKWPSRKIPIDQKEISNPHKPVKIVEPSITRQQKSDHKESKGRKNPPTGLTKVCSLIFEKKPKHEVEDYIASRETIMNELENMAESKRLISNEGRAMKTADLSSYDKLGISDLSIDSLYAHDTRKEESGN